MVSGDSNSHLEGLFITEVKQRLGELSEGLLGLEDLSSRAAALKKLMRTTHAMKGAAGMLGYAAFLEIAHKLESRFEALAKDGGQAVRREEIDNFFQIVDAIGRLYLQPAATLTDGSGVAGREIELIEKLLAGEVICAPPASDSLPESNPTATLSTAHGDNQLGFMPVRSKVIDELIGKSAEHLVSGRHLASISAEIRERYLRADLIRLSSEPGREILGPLDLLQTKAAEMARLSDTLYDTALRCKHRPFSDVSVALHRLVREVSATLGKQVKMEVSGEQELIDRETLRLLEEPIGHLLRNSIDHGIETLDVRSRSGKADIGTIRLSIRLSLGWLKIEVTDDGGGIDRKALRAAVVQKGLTSAELAERMSDPELLAFIFLPGFSTRTEATAVSGRGIGLDAVHAIVTELGGDISVISEESKFTTFSLKVPVRRSLQTCLVFLVTNELHALPLSRVVSVIDFDPKQIEDISGVPCIRWDGAMIPCIGIENALGLAKAPAKARAARCVIVNDVDGMFGVTTSEEIGYEELSIQNLEHILGKTSEVRGAAINDRGAVITLLETSSMLARAKPRRSVEPTISIETETPITSGDTTRRKILVVDDSLTVRELERKLLVDHGYDVVVASDGVEGWSRLRDNDIELVVTDVDMPRMNGFALVESIRASQQLKELPIVIVSYKEREEEKLRGLELGADRYLTKGSFHDATFIGAIRELLG